MGLLNRIERHFGRFAIPNLPLYLIGGQIMFLGLALLGGFDLRRILLVPALVLQGEVWRLFSFVLMPPISGPLSMTGALFLAISWYFFYMISQALESYWGAFRFNIYFFTGWALTVCLAFFVPGMQTSYEFFAVSVFLAFALLNPDFELYLFFILPVKIKWFALITWIWFGFEFVTGSWNVRLAILAATGNFFLFFTGEILQRLKTGQRQRQQQVRRTAMREAADEPRHRCVICGKTDRTHPQLDFRYCSQCAGEECYCSEHIRDHVHTTVAKPG